MFSATANTLKAMLQQFDGQLNAKETYLHEQRGKLSEKDKVIVNQKMEMERLEKKSKTLEYKVLSLSRGKFYSFLFGLQQHSSKAYANFILILRSFNYYYLTLPTLLVLIFRLISCKRQQKCMSRTNAHFSRSWRTGNKGYRESCQGGGAWSSACRAL